LQNSEANRLPAQFRADRRGLLSPPGDWPGPPISAAGPRTRTECLM
jgi:hypothetical protein